ncbi:hypothetical protein HRI_004300800 [Hibiscus trionum]|uniref:AP2/ERF domain-containing protein n=1 Tax=Hibiscus trionum TaxID=183268 RepID=A0A9W7J1Z3_HIBTR|nr:hypothetical protein HRI_004300800 [Hibiscus trionum]
MPVPTPTDGVTPRKKKKKKKLWLGTFDTAEDAARALRGANSRTNFELPRLPSDPSTKSFSVDNLQPWVSCGALKAKLLDGKGIGTMNPVQGSAEPGSSQPDHVINHDQTCDGPVGAGQIGVQWHQPVQSQAPSMTSMMRSESLEATWGTQMKRLPPGGLFNISTSTAATSSTWPLPGTTESTADLSFPGQCSIELQMNMSSRANMVSMPVFQTDGTTIEGVWSSEPQFLHGDNSLCGPIGSWDPCLYVSSMLD